MSAEMTKRERVERTLAGVETDRVPLYDLLRSDSAIAHFSGERLPPLAQDERTVTELNRLTGKAVNACLDMTRSVGFGPVVDADITDQWGFLIHVSAREKTSWIARRPFHDEEGARAHVEKWIAVVREQTGDIARNPRAYRERYHADFLHTQSLIGDTVNLLAEQGVGLDDIRHQLGLELFAYLEADAPGLISEAMEAMTEHNLAACHAIADPALSPVVLTYGDIACKQRLLHSPVFLRREFFPRLTRLNAAWHEHGLRCLFHSDGYVMEVMDDLIAAGIDGVNPIETLAGMSLKDIRERCGRKLFLAGGIDMSQLLSRGSPEEVRAVCRQAIRDAGRGYFMGSTTEIDNSCRFRSWSP
jgi:hypothetical protein